MTREVEYLNLDLILSVGYRVKSPEGVRFRKWANDVLRRHLIDGAAINERRLAELGQVVSILSRSSARLASGIAEVVSACLPGLVLLHDYDEGSVETSPSTAPTWQLILIEARKIIATVVAEFPSDTLAGRERGVTRVTSSALAAITLLVASSDPREKDLMISLIVKMLALQS